MLAEDEQEPDRVWMETAGGDSEQRLHLVVQPKLLGGTSNGQARMLPIQGYTTLSYAQSNMETAGSLPQVGISGEYEEATKPRCSACSLGTKDFRKQRLCIPC